MDGAVLYQKSEAILECWANLFFLVKSTKSGTIAVPLVTLERGKIKNMNCHLSTSLKQIILYTIQ